MDSVLFNQLTKQLASAKTPEALAQFEEQERLRIFALTEEEREAELAFLEQEFLAIKALVEQARKEKAVTTKIFSLKL